MPPLSAFMMINSSRSKVLSTSRSSLVRLYFLCVFLLGRLSIYFEKLE